MSSSKAADQVSARVALPIDICRHDAARHPGRGCPDSAVRSTFVHLLMAGNNWGMSNGASRSAGVVVESPAGTSVGRYTGYWEVLDSAVLHQEIPSSILACVDADTAHTRAVAAGARSLAPVQADFSGARHGLVQCPFGHRWILTSRTEDLSADEIAQRFRDWLAAGEPLDLQP